MSRHSNDTDQPRPDGFANAGERTAFERFRDQLGPEGWTIAHNLYVSRRDERGGRARELDLLLLHPRHGLVLVEVKGGKVACGSEGTWTQNGERMSRDPMSQAASALRVLRQAVADHPALGPAGVAPRTAWMLCLPGADAPAPGSRSSDGSLSLSLDQVVDRGALSRDGGVLAAVTRFVERLGIAEPGVHAPDYLGDQWVGIVVDTLLPHLDFSTSLIGDLDVDQARLAADERIHAGWVENLGGLSRLHFEAGAGGGKSVIARLRALSLARSGRSVLLVCSTASLAKSLQRDVQDKSNGRALVNTLHQVLILKARRTGRPEAFGIPAEGQVTIEQLGRLPEQTAAIAAASADRYDALVVDEAQDIGAATIEALTGFLHDPAEGSVWTFADAFQNLRPEPVALGGGSGAGDAASLPTGRGADVVIIRQNHRNPEPVFRLAEGLRADGVPRTSRKGEISSHRVDYRETSAERPQRVVLEEVMDWLAGQRIERGRVAVVTIGRTEDNPVFTDRRFHGPTSKFWEMDNPQLDADGRRRPEPVEAMPAPDTAKVYFDSARRMKGLERGVVILVDVPDPGPEGSIERRLLYAGVTRATTYLCVIATAERIAALKRIGDGYRA